MIKYFTLASVSCDFDDLEIRGTKDKRLSSIPIHKYSQFDLDKAMIVPIIIVEKNRSDEGVIKL